MWPAPQVQSLIYSPNLIGLKWSEAAASVIMSFWIYLVISMLGAFAISYYFSANTIIYYLMRREVDATELDDVYVEDSDETSPKCPPLHNAPQRPRRRFHNRDRSHQCHRGRTPNPAAGSRRSHRHNGMSRCMIAQ